ncbi:MAG: TPM domain-containing protein [Limnohabitans sp.]
MASGPLRMWPALRMVGGWLLLSLAFALCLPGFARAQDLQPVPPLQAHINDLSRTLAASEAAQLEQQLAGFEAQHGTQIAVLLVNSTAPEDIADYTQRVAESWKLGRARVGDGLLLVVAVQDRRVRIAPYKALEGTIPDVLAKRIIDQQMVPAFRQGDYAGGLRQALAQLQALIKGEALPAPAGNTSGAPGAAVDLVEFAMLLLVAVPMLAAVLRQWLGQRLGALVGAGVVGWVVWQISGRVWMALLAALIGFFASLISRGLPNTGLRRSRWSRHIDMGHGGWGGGGFGGGGGGGFGGHGGTGGFGGMSSGGGGDAGGGGASGSW